MSMNKNLKYSFLTFFSTIFLLVAVACDRGVNSVDALTETIKAYGRNVSTARSQEDLLALSAQHTETLERFVDDDTRLSESDRDSLVTVLSETVGLVYNRLSELSDISADDRSDDIEKALTVRSKALVDGCATVGDLARRLTVENDTEFPIKHINRDEK